MIIVLFKFFLLIIPCLLCVAFFTLLERKVLGLVGLRLGPFKVSMGGILQPIGDAGKLSNKEINNLSNFSFFFYYFSSSIMLFRRIFLLLLLSFDSRRFCLKSSILILLILLGLNRLNSIFRGWSTFSKFSLLGRLRTVSQLISYEVLLYVCFFFFFFIYFCYDLFFYSFFEIKFFFFFIPNLFLVWFLSILAELNRTPYDFSEGERELVRGFNIEFGSSCFTFIFLAEYGNIFFFIILTRYLFFSGIYFFFFFTFFLVLWIRSVLPRYRFDKLMSLSWKVLLPQIVFLFILFFSLFI